MTERHQADPEYLSHLEWQMETELRRAQAFAGESKEPGRFRGLRTLALAVLCLFLGGAGVVTAQRYENSWQAQLWTARAQTSLELAIARTRILEEEIERMRGQETSHPETTFLMQEELAASYLELKEAELNLLEVQATGKAPRDDLSAPLAGGLDLVSERTQLHLERLAQRKASIEGYWAGLGREEQQARGSEAAMIGHELQQLDSQMDELRRRMQLRRDFLDGKLDARQVELRERLATLESESARMDSRVELATRQLEELVSQGEASELAARRAKFDLTTIRANARLVRTELDLVRRQLQQ